MNDIKITVGKFEALLGIKLYLVGGSVRDKLIDIPHTDLDFATPTEPDQIETAVRAIGKRPYLAGKRFGTVGFKYEGETIEITTFRTEVYGKTRKPEVRFVDDIVKDLSRRDFTVNAMAVDSKGKLIDPFSGHADIKAGVVRFVGNPSIRINEDPLRMLRACRLSAQFDFVPLPETKEKIKENAVKILRISRERWTQELDKMLMSLHPHRGLDALAQTELLRYILPELWIQYHYDQNSPYHGLSLFEHTKKTVELTANDIHLRWAAILHDIGKPFSRIDKPVTPGVFTVDTESRCENCGPKRSEGELREPERSEGRRERKMLHFSLKGEQFPSPRTRFWGKDTQANYPHHAEIGAEFVEKIGKYLKWSNERLKKVKTLVLEHLKLGESPLQDADSAAR